MNYQDCLDALGYSESANYHDEPIGDWLPPSERHWHRAARAAGVIGSYFFKTTPGVGEEPPQLRAAVHVARADTEEAARALHRELWNQGMSPFLIVVLPGQVRVYSGFAYDPDNPKVGEVVPPLDRVDAASIQSALAAFRAEAIDRGEIWRVHGRHLGVEHRVDTTLLGHLSELTRRLRNEHGLSARVAHAIIGKFIYLSYLRSRNILSDKWIRRDAKLDPAAVFDGVSFRPTLTLVAFRQLVRAVEDRFNGLLFPISWGGPYRPDAAAVRLIARVFAGEEATGQMHLAFRAYDFSRIPVEFLSSVYEQFIHEPASAVTEADAEDDEEVEDDAPNASADPEKGGAHYTPEPLAEYLVSELQSVRPLRPGMKILDPCCGSGVFLVVAYRRLIELVCAQEKREFLPPGRLGRLLQDSIYGVELNESACQITSFSLILTLLAYVDPPELHALPKFPTLLGRNIFRGDFFDAAGNPFWARVGAPGDKALRFDWVVGNPPWVELEDNLGTKAQHVRAWISDNPQLSVPRGRTGEAFAWRALDCAARDGAVGLVLHAKTLTNDQVQPWRKAFFGGVRVHRLTNFANLAYVLFTSAQPPAFTLVFSRRDASATTQPENILHVGPFAFNQPGLKRGAGARRKSWVLGLTESEIKQVPQAEAASGEARVWKQALWSNPLDIRAIKNLRQVFALSLGEVVKQRGWKLKLGLQLRSSEGKRKDPAQYVEDLEELPVLDHKGFARRERKIIVPDHLIKTNDVGCFVRKQGGLAGLQVVRGPHLLLMPDFAAYSAKDFIILHDKQGLSGGSAKAMKAVAAIWNSHLATYLLFHQMSAAWGMDRTQIDKGDSEQLPFPDLTPERETALAQAFDEASKQEADGASFAEVKNALTDRVVVALRLPAFVASIAREFFEVRYLLNKSKAPEELRRAPEESQLRAYAEVVRDRLDAFLDAPGRHRLGVLHDARGVAVSITLGRATGRSAPVTLTPAEGARLATLRGLLAAAEERFSQWAYVRKSMRLFDGDTIHLLKPAQRIEWTRTQAQLDAEDLIAEIVAQQISPGR